MMTTPSSSNASSSTTTTTAPRRIKPSAFGVWEADEVGAVAQAKLVQNRRRPLVLWMAFWLLVAVAAFTFSNQAFFR